MPKAANTITQIFRAFARLLNARRAAKLETPLETFVEATETRTIAGLLNPRRTAKLNALRAFGRQAGVAWLRDVLKEYRVERISDLSDKAVDRLLAEFEGA